jgi:hypothetical protein
MMESGHPMTLSEATEWFKFIGAIGGVGAIVWGVAKAVWSLLYKDRPFVTLTPEPQGRGVRLRISNPLPEDLIISSIDLQPRGWLAAAAADNPRDAIYALITMHEREPLHRVYMIAAKDHLELALVRSNECPDTGKANLTIRWHTTTEPWKPLLAVRKTLSLARFDQIYSASERLANPEGN